MARQGKDTPGADRKDPPVRSGGYILTEDQGWVLDPAGDDDTQE